MVDEDKLRGFLNRVVQTTEELGNQKTKSNAGFSFPSRSYFLSAEKYVRLFLEKKINQRIILLPGLRGIGKTTLLFQLYNHLLNVKKIPKERLLYIDAGELKNNIGGKMNDLFKIYEEVYLKNPLEMVEDPLFIFIDEAHYDPEWPSFTKSLFDRSDGKKNALIFVSGSSALALRANTDLSRRAIIDHLYPLTFQEYLLLKHSFFPPKGTAEKIRMALNSDVESAHYTLLTAFNSLQSNLSKKGISIENSLSEFLAVGASPLSLSGGPIDLYFRWWIGVLEKVVQQDIPSFSPLSQKKSPEIFGLLQFLAESIPSPQSLQGIASKIDETSKTTVHNIFEALKNSCLLVEVHPDVDPLKRTNVPSKYYFTHSTIRAALLWSIGKFRKDLLLNDHKYFGMFLEDLIASTLIRNKERGNTVLEVAFDSQKDGSDFIIKTPTGNIAIECCWGEKDSCQVRKTMERYKCKFAIVVSKVNLVSLKENVITVPRELLLFI